MYRPGTEEADIGGDWYDAFLLPGDRAVLTVGDVAGRGLDAAMLMGEVRHAIRAAAFAGHDPAKVLQVANSVVRSGPFRMVTAVVVMVDPLTLHCTYAAAGHPGPLLVTPTGIETLSDGTFPLGIQDGLPIAAESLRLPPSALLVLYTDGLTEFDRDGVAGEALLRRAVADHFARGVATPAQAIVNQVLAGRPVRDDVAILTAFVEPGVGR
jgi:serine phosphatase RsbU (regulator of sigma subunit)